MMKEIAVSNQCINHIKAIQISLFDNDIKPVDNSVDNIDIFEINWKIEILEGNISKIINSEKES